MQKLIMDNTELDNVLAQISEQIIQKNKNLCDVALVGIRKKGRYLAQLIASYIEEQKQIKLLLGTVDTTLYRDDISTSARRPLLCHTEIPFAISDKKIILVDDVLYTGRTIRAALDALIDLGRPQVIELAVLIDRGHRELPICADYVGEKIPTTQQETIKLIIENKSHKVVMQKDNSNKKW